MTVTEEEAEEETATEAGTAEVMVTEAATVEVTVTEAATVEVTVTEAATVAAMGAATVEVTVGHARTKIYFNDSTLRGWRYVCRTARQPHHGVTQYRRPFSSCPVSDLNLT